VTETITTVEKRMVESTNDGPEFHETIETETTTELPTSEPMVETTGEDLHGIVLDLEERLFRRLDSLTERIDRMSEQLPTAQPAAPAPVAPAPSPPAEGTAPTPPAASAPASAPVAETAPAPSGETVVTPTADVKPPDKPAKKHAGLFW